MSQVDSDYEQKRQFAIQSLKVIYHGGYRSSEEIENTLCMSDGQFETARQRYDVLSEREKAQLHARYCESDGADHTGENALACSNELLYWALRDSDGDGILDFRVKELGSFIQNDPDADNDGIENLMDSSPLQTHQSSATGIEDQDDDGLPDHLDWSNAEWHSSFAGKSDALIEIQNVIFDDFGIVLIESEGSEISERFADMTLDVLNVFRSMYEEYDARKFTRSITLAKQYDYDPAGVLAEVSPVNGQILVFEYGIENLVDDKRNLIAPFMVYIHEFAHVIQNSMDFPGNTESLLKFNAHQQADNFIKAIRRMDWTIPLEEQPELDLTGGFVDHGSEPVGFSEVFRETELSELRSVCNTEQEEETQITWAQYNIVTCYSLDGVREWHAEYIANTVLSQMFQYIIETYPRHSEPIIELAQDTMFEDWGGEYYDYTNADSRITSLLENELDLDESVIETISSRYLVEPYLNASDLTVADISEVELLTDR